MTTLHIKKSISKQAVGCTPAIAAAFPIKLEIDLPAEVIGQFAEAVAERIRSLGLVVSVPPGEGVAGLARSGRHPKIDASINESTPITPMDRLHPLPHAGYMRLREVLTMIPISRATWYQGIKQGRYPRPKKFGRRISAWDAHDIRKLLEGDQD